MRVLYDDDVFSVQVYGGISRYFTQLIEALGAVADIDVHLPFWLTVNTHLAASRHFKGYASAPAWPFPADAQ